MLQAPVPARQCQGTHDLPQLQPGLPAQLHNSLTGWNHTSTARRKTSFFSPLKNCDEYFGNASISPLLCHHHEHHQGPWVQSSSSHLARFSSLLLLLSHMKWEEKRWALISRRKWSFPTSMPMRRLRTGSCHRPRTAGDPGWGPRKRYCTESRPGARN